MIEAMRDAKRLRLIATALEFLQYEKSDSAAIPIPGTTPQRYVMIGGAATVAKLLEIDQAPAVRASLVGDVNFRQMMQEFLMGHITVDQVAVRINEWAAGQPAGAPGRSSLPSTGMD